jgi:hypothetical protein
LVSNNQKIHLDYSEHKHNTPAGGSETAGSQQQQDAPETAWSQSKTGTSCREPTALRTSATAGMPAATWCARSSMGTIKNRDFIQGANSNKNVANSRDASSNMLRQKQHGHNQKQGLHAGCQQHKECRQ